MGGTCDATSDDGRLSASSPGSSTSESSLHATSSTPPTFSAFSCSPAPFSCCVVYETSSSVSTQEPLPRRRRPLRACATFAGDRAGGAAGSAREVRAWMETRPSFEAERLGSQANPFTPHANRDAFLRIPRAKHAREGTVRLTIALLLVS